MLQKYEKNKGWWRNIPRATAEKPEHYFIWKMENDCSLRCCQRTCGSLEATSLTAFVALSARSPISTQVLSFVYCLQSWVSLADMLFTNGRICRRDLNSGGGERSGQSLLRGSVQSYGSIHQQRARLIISEQRLLVYTQRAQQTLTILQPFALAQFKSAVRGFGPTWKRVHVGQTTIPVWTVHINTVRGRWWKGGYEWYHDEDIWWQHDGVKHIVCI